MTSDNSTNIQSAQLNRNYSADELLELESKFPYCSAIQFKLLQEFMNSDQESFTERTKKAGIYFPDLLKLNWQLHLNNLSLYEHKTNTSYNQVTEKEFKEGNIEENTETVDYVSEDSDKVLITEESIPEVHAPYISEIPPDNIPFIELEENENNGITADASSLLDQNNTPILENKEDSGYNEDETTVFQKELSTELVKEEEKQPFSENKEEVDQIHPLIESKEIEQLASPPLQQNTQLPIPETLKEDVQTESQATSSDKKEDLIFEPLYTKDYFASQGIKLNEQPASGDKLGNQMKSFTQWLKSMKKIHVEKLNEPDEVVDKKIQSIAEKSNITEEVVTESMADVLLLQGKHEKAIEMYEKLSLINPSKSAYFAAIIQVLKKA